MVNQAVVRASDSSLDEKSDDVLITLFSTLIWSNIAR